ncbi:uncharacterized protein DUF4238 [Roseimicrobium gellanilyticum]|uniref:Uncharacterized protein DUF4238 n=1 Tax=Roseimicrobium gellanilyticum TaxID=748857 RepID=A0A366HQD5_9BACT|nr:DUF4238 domain-containing protein [Roseimicrobium gellanilyticum]RBP45860.1 uncharacterized protein DUF4238 [Roseimicrobium gellanilyticum]
MSHNYVRNHYVPAWYQRRFLDPSSKDKELFYLDLAPSRFVDGRGKPHIKRALKRQGPKKCFFERDLYTMNLGPFRSTDIEENFFGEIDDKGRDAVHALEGYAPGFKGQAIAFSDLLLYLSTQKLRTPRGLGWLRDQVDVHDRTLLLLEMMELRQMFCATWAECIWQIADAHGSPTKFILSDHPVVAYNRECRPLSPHCRGCNEPDIRMNGTHTIFPLSSEKVLILTNTSWARNPYQSATRFRPNPTYFRNTIIKVMGIQVERHMDEQEVREINYIIKRRAKRYIASSREEWLYPEAHISVAEWTRFGGGYLCMPDPRSMDFDSGIYIGYKDGRSDAFDLYGRKPWQQGYSQERSDAEWQAFLNFQGEFARLVGPRRKGRAFRFGELDKEVDDEDFHKYHLRLETRRRRSKL